MPREARPPGFLRNQHMKLYYVPGTCSLAPHIALREAGLPFSLDKMNRETRVTESGENYLLANPKGSVPALRLDNNEVLTEVGVILLYVADQVPQSGLAPVAGSMARYRLMEWLSYISSDIHKQIGPFFNPKMPPEWRDNQIQVLARRLPIVADRLRQEPYLMGDRLTVADCYLYAVLRWCDRFKIDLSAWPSLRDFMTRMAARPAVHAALEAEGLLQ
jgi:glutathione S-transferase